MSPGKLERVLFGCVALKATEQPIDTSTAAGKAFLDMLGVFAEFETNLRKERQLEGIAKAKAEGVYAKNGGRKATLDADKLRQLHASGMGPAVIAKQLRMARSSVYRLLEDAAERRHEARAEISRRCLPI
jgi:DNA invertase Pin-like site-specific DNA recombinase